MNIMNLDISGNTSNLDKKINPEQFDQVVEAILAGKYSWAVFCCYVLLATILYITFPTAPTIDYSKKTPNLPKPRNNKTKI